jgi:hypothetical protein
MEDSLVKNPDRQHSGSRRTFRRVCAAFVRWVFIVVFAVILLGGLYFHAPWKVLVLDAVLLGLLTIVPKPWRKYSWGLVGLAVIGVAVWIFLPEKDSDNWKPYTFDEELAVLEAQRAVTVEMDAAALYETLSEQWKQIEESDPFPKEADDDCKGTMYRPWTTDEFPEIAAWFDRHQGFFQDLIIATQKPKCYFPAAVTVWELSESMDRLTPMKRFAKHLIRASNRDIGENRDGAWKKQTAALNLATHLNQQPMLIDSLLGLAIENMALSAMRETLVSSDQLPNLTMQNYHAIIVPIKYSYFDQQEKLKQTIAYEKLLTKNVWGMFYEINPEGQVRYSRFESFIDIMNETYPDEQTNKWEPSCWTRADRKLSRIIFWFCGLPRNPDVISDWMDEAYAPLEQAIAQNKFPEIDTFNIPFELNYRYLVRRLTQTAFSSYKRIQEIFDKIRINRKGTEIVCDIVFYRNQQGQYPNTLDNLRASDEERQAASDLYSGFVYHKTDSGFMLYHIGRNGVDEGGRYKMPAWDPNNLSIEQLHKMKPEPDDILIWPEEVEDIQGTQ